MAPLRLLLVLLPLAVACRTPPSDKVDTAEPVVAEDRDGDGYGEDDCDDADATIHPGAEEACDGLDNDCDGVVDDGVTGTWYFDDDGDGYGDPARAVTACAPPGGTVEDGTDCDDGDDGIHPGADEHCDGRDEDCDDLVDEDAVDATTWYTDADGDGWGQEADFTTTCRQPEYSSPLAGDCDDWDPRFHPGAEESDCTDPNDYNCDGSVGYADVDGDGWAACEECDDLDAAVRPGATEVCNGVDDDCDGVTDGPEAEGATPWYADTDGDGFGDAASATVDCTPPTGSTADATDCDDTDATVSPAGTELCNGVDDDCDGRVDEDAADAVTWYADADADGHGDPTTAVASCDAADGHVADATDCDDTDASVHPGATEVCNGVDDDCDGATDEGAADMETWYADADADGYGDPAATTTACDEPAGYTDDATDCDDADVSVHPGATEACNGTDDDCDGATDEGAADAPTWYADADGDGYGDATDAVASCDTPSGHVADATDCNDTDASVHPGATEVCNGTDDDCDGTADEDAADVSTWYWDGDLDGFGDAGTSTTACDEPAGYTDDATDCDDTNPDVNPLADDVCNGEDDDCSGFADDTWLCPCAVEFHLGAPYMFCTELTAWEDARDFCDTYGYHLLTIDDATENEWADTTADSYSTAKWWMGFNDRDAEGTWVWEDGSTVSWTNWAAGEPNDTGSGEDCGQLNRYHPDQTWNDEPCSYTFSFVCEAW